MELWKTQSITDWRPTALQIELNAFWSSEGDTSGLGGRYLQCGHVALPWWLVSRCTLVTELYASPLLNPPPLTLITSPSRQGFKWEERGGVLFHWVQSSNGPHATQSTFWELTRGGKPVIFLNGILSHLLVSFIIIIIFQRRAYFLFCCLVFFSVNAPMRRLTVADDRFPLKKKTRPTVAADGQMSDHFKEWLPSWIFN